MTPTRCWYVCGDRRRTADKEKARGTQGSRGLRRLAGLRGVSTGGAGGNRTPVPLNIVADFGASVRISCESMRPLRVCLVRNRTAVRGNAEQGWTVAPRAHLNGRREPETAHLDDTAIPEGLHVVILVTRVGWRPLRRLVLEEDTVPVRKEPRLVAEPGGASIALHHVLQLQEEITSRGSVVISEAMRAKLLWLLPLKLRASRTCRQRTRLGLRGSRAVPS